MMGEEEGINLRLEGSVFMNPKKTKWNVQCTNISEMVNLLYPIQFNDMN